MKKVEHRNDQVKQDDIVELGVASEVTKGIPSHVTQEAFLQRLPIDELSAD